MDPNEILTLVPPQAPTTEILTSIVTPAPSQSDGILTTEIFTSIVTAPSRETVSSSSRSLSSTLATSATSSESGTPAPTSQTPNNNSNSNSNSNSNALKVGLGVGLSLGLVLIIALGIIFYLLRRRHLPPKSDSASEQKQSTFAAFRNSFRKSRPTTYHEAAGQPISELEGQQLPVEIHTRGQSVKHEKKQHNDDLPELVGRE